MPGEAPTLNEQDLKNISRSFTESVTPFLPRSNDSTVSPEDAIVYITGKVATEHYMKKYKKWVQEGYVEAKGVRYSKLKRLAEMYRKGQLTA